LCYLYDRKTSSNVFCHFTLNKDFDVVDNNNFYFKYYCKIIYDNNPRVGKSIDLYAGTNLNIRFGQKIMTYPFDKEITLFNIDIELKRIKNLVLFL
jgi:hypothetical protein